MHGNTHRSRSDDKRARRLLGLKASQIAALLNEFFHETPRRTPARPYALGCRGVFLSHNAGTTPTILQFTSERTFLHARLSIIANKLFMNVSRYINVIGVYIQMRNVVWLAVYRLPSTLNNLFSSSARVPNVVCVVYSERN